MNSEVVIKQVDKWLRSVVIDLNLCPFALREYRQNKIRFSVSKASSEEFILKELAVELELLSKGDSIETSLLILPKAFTDFLSFNDFLGFADQLIEEMNFDGVFQIASFHPNYQFAGTSPSDPENYTNRSPYPILHLLREDSLEQAIEHHPKTDQIPEDNIALMTKLGKQHMSALLQNCMSVND